MHRAFQFLVPAVVILAIVGLSHQIVTNPLGLLRTLLFIALFIVGIFVVYRLFMMKQYGTPFLPQRSGPSRKQLQKAKRTSTVNKSAPSKFPLRNVQSPTSHSKVAPLKKKKPVQRNRSHNLTVIEGKKNKKKNRALF
ncbi:SA1362 family protein [Alkalihalobacillus pseudalcaliphilus]|uniref:SA1362 family protein n=1 Tax=Alkalihalobacillus pseudalcaliphilus TaxID=79884 RepID=UPI00064D785C|nr:SA1362 family protein [Alkalihalobacillus pseudalcaliphilus]KMK76980.1 hypothetical protein AB990_05315 [Alkalihalobacillus pseudalcaliphilus]